jgi:hypothetical protein
MNKNMVAGIAQLVEWLSYWLENRIFLQFLTGEGEIYSETSSPNLDSMQYPIQLTSMALSGVKAASRKANHSPPSSAEFKNEWDMFLLPSHAVVAFPRTNLPLMLLIQACSERQEIHFAWSSLNCSLHRCVFSTLLTSSLRFTSQRVF